jgi:hypothetical protein
LSATEWATATAQQLLSRHGIVTREIVASESVSGGFTAVYDVLKAMEHAGLIRRGYFVAGLGGAQFALPPALDLLRSLRDAPEEPKTVVLASTDPASPYGSIVKWPDPTAGAARTVGSLVILVDGFAAAYLRRGERELLLFVPDAEPQRSRMTREVARMLMHLAASRPEGRRGMLIAEINSVAAPAHPSARFFVEEGFSATAMGLQARTERLRPRGYETAPSGSALASRSPEVSMADSTRDDNRRNTSTENPSEVSEDRQERSGDGMEREHERGYDEAVTGRSSEADEESEDVDPDSAKADVDRDDSIDEI